MVASLISARTIVPLCYMMYRPKERTTAPLSGLVTKMQNGYRGIMKSLLPKKKTVMFTTVALLVISLFLATQLKTELMPANDQGTISITVGLRPGLGIEKANEILSEIEDYVANDEDVESYMLSYGSSGLSISGGSSASLTAYLKMCIRDSCLNVFTLILNRRFGNTGGLHQYGRCFCNLGILELVFRSLRNFKDGRAVHRVL